ncbi:hypothetical protein ACOSQ4_002791 [Xanthoceras sorbifolium]
MDLYALQVERPVQFKKLTVAGYPSRTVSDVETPVDPASFLRDGLLSIRTRLLWATESILLAITQFVSYNSPPKLSNRDQGIPTSSSRTVSSTPRQQCLMARTNDKCEPDGVEDKGQTSSSSSRQQM